MTMNAKTAMQNCSLCPRRCDVDRAAGITGVCGERATVRLARAALHFWEEPPISGESGSGTVFFSGCPLKCVYCQNSNISAGTIGKEVSVERLAKIFLEQQGRGALNINLVTPTHFVPQIIEALDLARDEGLALPIVYNTSGYETVQTIQSLEGYVDVYLTDFKYASSDLAKRYSNAPDYPRAASESLDAMFAQVGTCIFGADPRPENLRTHEEGELLLRGVVVRHLVIPGCVRDSFAIMRHLASKPYVHDLLISIMNQYTPMEGVGERYPELAGKVCDEDYEAVVDYALALGLDNTFMQEGEAATESFIPDFDYEGVK